MDVGADFSSVIFIATTTDSATVFQLESCDLPDESKNNNNYGGCGQMNLFSLGRQQSLGSTPMSSAYKLISRIRTRIYMLAHKSAFISTRHRVTSITPLFYV